MKEGNRKVPDYVQRRLSKIHVLTHAELRSLFAVITDVRDRALFLVAYRHGLRASEVSQMETTDVDLSRKKIAIRRLSRGSDDHHPLQTDEKTALARYLKTRQDDSVVLFLTERGQAISRRGLDWLMKSYGDLARLPEAKQHFHTLKHSVATHLLSAGADLLSVHHWLGHTSLPNTALYLYLASPSTKLTSAHRKTPGPGRLP